MVNRNLRLALVAIVLWLNAAPGVAAVLAPDLPSGQPVGITVRWTLTGDGGQDERFRLSVGRPDDPSSVRVMYDYAGFNVFAWTPVDEGVYTVVGTVRDVVTGNETESSLSFQVGPRTPQARFQPVVTPTPHPLVAFFSAPPCPAGLSMRVRFFAPSVGAVSTTTPKDCRAGRTLNFYVGGMRGQTTYLLQHQILDANGAVLGTGSVRPFQTGAVPVNTAPALVNVPAAPGASLVEQVLLISPVFPNFSIGVRPTPYAIDLAGEVVWYWDGPSGEFVLIRPGGDGTFYSLSDDGFLQWNLVGNVVRQTSRARLNEQLAAAGLDTINNVHHEARLLPNGHVAILGAIEKLLEDVQGPGIVDVLGDMVIILDEDMQIAWTWNAFDHLDAARPPTLETDQCPPGRLAGCPPVLLIEEGFASDWMHTNTVTYDDTDGNLLVSVRNQDWIIKIDYRDGAGDGSILWRLGNEGDFALVPADPDGWFSHPHDPNFLTPNRVVVYDNSNVRCQGNPGCESRGQVIELDEANLVATLVLNVDLGEYSFASGSSQPLLNGNVHFDSGLAGLTPSAHESVAREYQLDGTVLFEVQSLIRTYRSHRLTDFYRLPPTWALPDN